MADRETKGKDKTLTKIDQRMINQRGFSQMKIEVMSPEMIEENKGISDVNKRCTSKEIAWQKTSICTKRKGWKKILT